MPLDENDEDRHRRLLKEAAFQLGEVSEAIRIRSSIESAFWWNSRKAGIGHSNIDGLFQRLRSAAVTLMCVPRTPEILQARAIVNCATTVLANEFTNDIFLESGMTDPAARMQAMDDLWHRCDTDLAKTVEILLILAAQESSGPIARNWSQWLQKKVWVAIFDVSGFGKVIARWAGVYYETDGQNVRFDLSTLDPTRRLAYDEHMKTSESGASKNGSKLPQK